MTKQQSGGLAVILFLIFILQISNTPFLANKSWLVIILIGVFNVAAFYLVSSPTKDNDSAK